MKQWDLKPHTYATGDGNVYVDWSRVISTEYRASRKHRFYHYTSWTHWLCTDCHKAAVVTRDDAQRKYYYECTTCRDRRDYRNFQLGFWGRP